MNADTVILLHSFKEFMIFKYKQLKASLNVDAFDVKIAFWESASDDEIIHYLVNQVMRIEII